jgi:hypothetical protein
MKHVNKVIKNIDFALLKKQKSQLVAMLFVKPLHKFSKKEEQSLLGILHLLDNLGDAAISDKLWREK